MTGAPSSGGSPSPGPRRRWLTIAFTASLAVNLFLIGLIGGQLFAEPEETPQSAMRGYSLHPRVVMEALPEDRHADIQAYWDSQSPGIGRRWRGISELRREIDATVRAEPFDEEALRAAQQREVDARSDMRTMYNDKIADLIATLTDDERRAVSDLAMSRQEQQSAYWRDRARRRNADRD